MQSAHDAGVTLHAAVAGAGEALTFLHGFALHGGMWAPQIDAFRASHRTIAVDLPGFGRSPRRTPGSVADAIVATLDVQGIESTHIVGLSLGGAVAVDLVLAHPARVRTLTLADAFLLGYPATLDTWERCIALARGGECRAALDHWLTDGVFAVARTRPAAWAAIQTMIAGYDCAHWTGGATIRFASPQPRARLGEIRVPTLVVVGERDTPAFQAMADAYVTEIRGARRQTIAGAGHVSSLEEPAAFNRALATHLERAA